MVMPLPLMKISKNFCHIKSMNETLGDYQLEVVDRELVNSNKEEKVAFGTAKSFIRLLSLLVFCSII